MSTTDLTPEQLDKLERLERGATPGPWRSMRDGNQYINTSYMPTARAVAASRLDGVVRPWNPHALLSFGFKPEEYETARFLDADADLIAATRNALPALLAAARRLLELETAEIYLIDSGLLEHEFTGATPAEARAGAAAWVREQTGEQKGEVEGG